jgi:translation initiation factor IF-3
VPDNIRRGQPQRKCHRVKFDEAHRAKESRRKANNFGIKEMKYRPKIGNGDFDTKTRQVVKFLHEGHKVKITVMFRGREVFHSELGKKILDRIAEQVDGMARIESEARLDGKNMVMVLAPDRRALQATAAKAHNEAVGEPTGRSADGAPVEGVPGIEAPEAAKEPSAATEPAGTSQAATESAATESAPTEPAPTEPAVVTPQALIAAVADAEARTTDVTEQPAAEATAAETPA